MELFNIIVTRNGIVNEVESFGVVDAQLRSETIREAEDAYREKIVSIRHEDVHSEDADDLRDEIEENWIEEGYYEVGDDVNTVIHLAGSETRNIQDLS